jgi:isocitrate dehydrogenase
VATGPAPVKKTIGVDVFVDWDNGARNPADLAAKLEPLATNGLKLMMISNRGTKVWPGGQPETFCVDHWRCRFEQADGGELTHTAIVDLLGRVAAAGVDFIKTEHLCTFDGEPGYSRGQGQ